MDSGSTAPKNGRSDVISRSSRTTIRHRWGTGSTWFRVASAAVVATLFASAGAGAAVAAPGDRAQAEALFLSGDGLVDLDSLAELDGPYSQFTPGGAENAPLDVTALSLIEIGLGLQLFGGNDVLDLGATGQYAATDREGAVAASGLITGTGAIAAGSGAPAQQTTLDLGPVLDDAAADDLISALSLELGALSARAESTRGATVTTSSDYQVAGGVLRLESPALVDLTTGLDGTLEDTSDTVNGITGTGGAIAGTSAQLFGPIRTLLNGLLGGLVTLTNTQVTSTLDLDLGTALDAATEDAFVSGPVTIDLATGELLIDLEELYALNDLDPNTRLLDDPAINAQITAAISDILTEQLPDAVIAAVTDVLNTTTLTVTLRADASLIVVGGIGTLNATITGSVGSFLGLEGQPVPAVSLAGTNLAGLPVATLLGPLTTLVTDTLVPNVLRPVIATAVDLDGLETLVTTAGTTAVTALAPLLGLLDEIVRVTINVQEQPGAFRDPAGDDAASFTQTAVRIEILPDAADVVTLNLASATVTAVPLAVPTIGSIDPDRGPAAGGTSVIITGTGFEDVTGDDAVLFDGVPAASYVVDSDTQITAVTPAHAPATVDVTVTNPDGASAPGEFTFFPLTEVTGVDPGFGDEDGGTTVTITGSCFTDATGVLFGTTPGTGFTVVDDETITVTSPAGVGTVDVTVVNPTECGDATVEDGFTFVPDGAAVITDLEPDRGPEVGGTEVTITGAGFLDTEDVLFDGVPATEWDVVSDTEIVAVSPAHDPATVGVQVITSAGGSAPADFTYYAVTTVDAVDPDEGPLAGGTEVTLTGSCFTDATAVLFGDVPATDVVVVSDTVITAVSPAGVAVGSVDVTVVGAGECADGGDGGPGTLPDGFEYLAAPLVTALDPDRGPVTGGTEVTIDGTGFTGATEVSFGGVPGTDLTVVSDTEIVVTTPAGDAPGAVDVVVTAPSGVSEPGEFTYVPVTDIVDVTPDSGDEDGGDTVTITGSCFTGATEVLFGTTPAASFDVVSDTEIIATTPAGVGTVDVTVTNPTECGDATLEDAFTFVPDGAATIAALEPDRGPSVGGTEVTVTGTGFDDTEEVLVDGVAVPTDDVTIVSDTELTFLTPAHAPEVVNVQVVTDVGASAPADFTYFDVTTIDEVDPGEGPEAGGNTVTITGSCFTGATAVLFGDVPATDVTVVSDTEITAVAPAGTPGLVDVTVVGAGECAEGGEDGPGTVPGGYEYLAAPTVSALDPDSGPVTGGTEVTITGKDLLGVTGADGVIFDGQPAASYTVVNDTTIVAVTPPHAAATVDVVVTGPGGASEPSDFTYFPVTVIEDITPNAGDEDGGTLVTIEGSCFTGATDVLFGDEPGTDLTVVSDGVITVVSPAGAGIVDVTIVNPTACGDATAEDAFTFVPDGAPVIATLDPDRGPVTGGTEVTVTGEGFEDVTNVLVDGESAPFFDIVSDTEILLVTPAHAEGVVPITLVTADGPSAPADFEFFDVTTVDAVDPAEGPLAGGTDVTITGSCFTGAVGVEFGGVAATSFEVVSDTEITAVVPAGTIAGVVDVTVIGFGECGADGPGTLPDGFTYLDAPAPAITELDPDRGPVVGGTVVTVTGTGFDDDTIVILDGDVVDDVTVVSDTEIEFTTPAHTAGTVDVVVENAAGESAPADFTFYGVTTIDEVDPPSGPLAGGNTVTLTGSCFAGAEAVLFGTTPADFTVVSDTEITAEVPAGTTAGAVDVTVVGGGECGDGGEDGPGTVPDGYLYVAPPTVTGLDPDRGPVTGGTEVTITGTGFDGLTADDAVEFDGIAAEYTVVSDTEITAISPAHAVGAVDVTVSSEGGTSEPGEFEYFATAAIDEIAPEFGPEEGGTVVTITGTCFTGATGVLFGTTPGTEFEVISDTEISVVSPAGTGTVDVTVTNPTECGDATLEDGFVFVAEGAPAIAAIEPDRGPETGGTRVTITGEGFADATSVTFDGIAGTELTVIDDTEIEVVTPVHAPEIVDVVVTNGAGGSGPGDFEFFAVTAVDEVDPGTGPVGGGNTVTITGSCFTGATGVLFGGNASPSITVVSDTEITAVVPAGVRGTVDVTVVGAGDCGDGTIDDGYTYTDEPVVSSITPDRGPVAGGTLVTITGQGLGDATAVTFDGIEGTGLTDPTALPADAIVPLAIVSDTVITVYSPAHPVGTVDLVVVDPDGASEPVDFTYFGAAVPDPDGGTDVDIVTPPRGPSSGGTAVTITGSCFTDAVAVFFGDVPARSFTVISDTEIRAVSPAGSGAVDVTVIGSVACGTGSLPGAFSYTSGLAVTGSGGGALPVLALLLLLGGLAGVWFSRRRAPLS
jgi:hypothetical protein